MQNPQVHGRSALPTCHVILTNEEYQGANVKMAREIEVIVNEREVQKQQLEQLQQVLQSEQAKLVSAQSYYEQISSKIRDCKTELDAFK